MNPIRYEVRDGIALVTIDRPDKRNSLDEAAVQGLHAAWRRFADSDERVAIVTGAGEQAFCAGVDLNAPPRDTWLAYPNLAVPCDKPIIAAVAGVAAGGGAAMVMQSDLAVCTPDARFIYPEAKVGLFAGVMGGFPARMPYKVGLEWTLTGDPMSAQRACEIGFVNAISAPGEHVQAAFALAQRIAANAPMVVRAIKHLALETLPRNPMADYYPHRQMLDAIAGSEDAREGARAFREKRPPKFEGR